MPAMLDDPTAPPIYRVSGEPPYPGPGYNTLPDDITIKQVTLRDRVTTATLVPFSSPHQVPPKLAAYLCDLLNNEIELGNTYPMLEPIALSAFTPYWFANFGAVMLFGDVDSHDELHKMEARGANWARQCLGSFYVKPNYPGRSSHVCNGGFLVTDSARNRGVGRLMGECYLDWAPRLGYTYSVFNLVYETNVASLRIWDALGFKRIGRVKGCGNLRSHPDEYIDAIIFGRELGLDADEDDREQRFDKIFYYLKTGTYPFGADRAEKSRLRSAATHYRIVAAASGDPEDDKLMLKGKEVVSDPHRQYDIARQYHAKTHGGINKTTASIAEKYHWVRIKETVSAAIRNCVACKEPAAASGGGKGAASSSSAAKERRAAAANKSHPPVPITPDMRASSSSQSIDGQHHQHHVVAGADMPTTTLSQQQPLAPIAQMTTSSSSTSAPNMSLDTTTYADMPVDPQIMQQWQAQAQAMEHGGDGGFDDEGFEENLRGALAEAEGAGGGGGGVGGEMEGLEGEVDVEMMQGHAGGALGYSGSTGEQGQGRGLRRR